MTHVQNIRIFLRPSRAYPEDRQREACASVVAKIGGPSVEYIAGTHDRAAWLKALRRDEVALVASLDLLAEPRKKLKGRPLVDFFATLADAASRCLYVIEADSGVTSKEPSKWQAVVEAAGNRIAAGRPLGRARAVKMARKRWEGRSERGTVDKWRRPHMAKERAQWGAIWRDPKHANVREALDALPEEINSVATAYRIFGPRQPGKGRPRKQKTR